MGFVTLAAALDGIGLAEARSEGGCRTVSSGPDSYTVCDFDPKTTDMRIVNRRPDGEPYGRFAALSDALWLDRLVLAFATNGGMYHADMSPVGLFVEYGFERKAAVTGGGYGNFHLLPNGVFAVGEGRAVVRETKAYLSSGFKADYVTQSGPMLVIDGKIHPRFLPDSDSLKIRNGVGIDAAGRAVFAISERPVRFYDFAVFFRDVLGCADALYLDGTISSLYAPEIGRHDRLFPLGTIIAVVRRLPD
ncbi:phosphodiester glycosidase family protein [Pseudomonas sp. R2.Fl]|nr:phosphodiester glycosidase family protein [Pseudomonas sp. R2.Fl]